MSATTTIPSHTRQRATGWHTLSSLHQLKPGYFGSDCAPLDAPNWIAGGSAVCFDFDGDSHALDSGPLRDGAFV